ncbi:serine/threonine protein kinase [Paenibacillus sp. sgz500958]|uniref:serine/threonine protein kinase n=1 Tax=Paenibacillus sp. sgz500958 TaxID=3242475 RepID=UPI0036D3F7F0
MGSLFRCLFSKSLEGVDQLERWRNFITAWRDYPPQPGSMIGERYQVLQVLGIGSYGIASLCRDKLADCEVVVKLAKPSKKQPGKILLEREKEVLSLLDHPFIQRLRDYGESKEGSWLVTDYVDGKTLEDLIFEEQRVIGERECLHWTLMLMDRVSHIHERGFVHLDLRIPNVIVQEQEIVVIDFGLARPIGGGQGRLWEDGALSSMPPPRVPPFIQSDLSDIAHLMLYMLYSSFHPDHGVQERTWEEELSLSIPMRKMLRRLLGLDETYADTEAFITELRAAFKGLPGSPN